MLVNQSYQFSQKLWAMLTPTERKILVCALEAYRDQEIADLLCCSLHTVRSHIRNICGKAGELYGHPREFRRHILPLFWQTGLPESDTLLYPAKR